VTDPFLRLLCALLGGCLVACVVADDPIVGDPERPFYTTPVQLVASNPVHDAETVPRDTTVWMTFDQHLNVSGARFFDALQMRSGEIREGIRIHYEMVDKRLVGRLINPLEPRLRYTLSADTERLRSVSGAVLETPTEVTFITGDQVEGRETEAALPGWREDIVPMLARGCSCHGPDEGPRLGFDIPIFTYNNLLNAVSTPDDTLRLVEPFVPTRSYIMHKVLEDYPIRQGDVMPPPWAATFLAERNVAFAGPLSRDDMRTLELWIRIGAPLERE